MYKQEEEEKKRRQISWKKKTPSKMELDNCNRYPQSKLNNHGLDSELKLEGSPQNFPIISILTKSNVTASAEMLSCECDVNSNINYCLVRFTPNISKKNNDVQIGFRIDSTRSVEVSSNKDILIDIYSETDSRSIGRFTARGESTMDIVKPRDKDESIILYSLEELRERTDLSDDIDMKDLSNYFTIRVMNGLTKVVWHLMMVID